MASRSIVLACALACISCSAAAQSQAGGFSVAPSRGPILASAAPSLSAYRVYASAQAEMLTRMTRLLAKDIRDGNVEAAQNEYAMAHRYLERIKPASTKLNGDLDRRMDAGLDDARTDALDSGGSGFHRVEHDLFASRSTNGLALPADRLHEDAVQLQKAISSQTMSPDVLVDGAIETIEAASSRTLAAGSEPYSQTELWDVEANLEGAEEVFAAMRPQIEPRDPLLAARISNAFAMANERLAQFREGCGFKYFGALTVAEKASLRDTTVALAHELSKLKAVPAID